MATFYIAVKNQADYDALCKMHGGGTAPNLESWKNYYTADDKCVYYRVQYTLEDYPCCCGLTLASGAYGPGMLQVGVNLSVYSKSNTFLTVLNYVEYVEGYMHRDIIASDVTGGKLHKLLDALTEFCANGVYTKRVLYEFINPSTGNTIEVVSYQHKKVEHLGREE